MKILMSLILILNSTIALAQSETSDSYNYNAMAFQKARALCQDVEAAVSQPSQSEPESSIDYLGLLKFAVLGTKTGFLFWRPESIRVTPETAAFVNSDGFKSALYACFGDNQTKQSAFKASILALDFLGHLAGISLWIIPTAVVARVFRNTSWAINNPALVNGFGRFIRVTNRVGLAVVVGVLGYQVWDSYQFRAEGKERLEELTESIVDNSKQESEESFSILQDLLDETNRRLTQVRPGDPRYESLQKRKAILEDRLKNHKAAAAS